MDIVKFALPKFDGKHWSKLIGWAFKMGKMSPGAHPTFIFDPNGIKFSIGSLSGNSIVQLIQCGAHI